MMNKSRETLARRMLDRRGLRLVKSRRRDPRALGYGEYMIVDVGTNTVVAGEIDSHRSMSIEEVEEWLARPAPAASTSPAI